ncbi:MAG: HD domain-containing protein [Anaerolineales bacterium]|nr:HD domain-containing protein [Anaerolineales bacterium]
MPTLEQARAWYAAADPVHDFQHVQRVLALAERLGRELGADLELLRAAVLLHDAEGAAPADAAGRAAHHENSAAFAATVLAAEGWPAERIAAVQHCIRAHRFRGAEAPRTLEAQILFDSDKLDVLGAIGAARAMAYAALAGQPLTGAPSERFRATGQTEPGEPHTPYHEYLFKLSKIKDRLHTPAARALAAERHRYLDEYFQRLAREEAGEA